MQQQLDWYIEKRVVHLVIGGDVSVQDMIDINTGLVALIRQGDPPYVHIILDITGVKKYPTSITTLTQSSAFLREPNVGWLLVITQDKVTTFLGGIVSQVAKVRFRTFGSFEEAVAFLREADATLDMSKANEKTQDVDSLS